MGPHSARTCVCDAITAPKTTPTRYCERLRRIFSRRSSWPNLANPVGELANPVGQPLVPLANRLANRIGGWPTRQLKIWLANAEHCPERDLCEA